MGWLLAAGAAGLGLNAYGKLQAGDSAKKRMQFKAKQLEQNAGKALSASQRQAQELDRQGRLQQSRALAIAASSGGGASDPTVMNLMAELAGGKYFSLADAPKLADSIGGQEQRPVTIRRERELWDLWIFFVAMLLLAGAEWYLRRRFDLI